MDPLSDVLSLLKPRSYKAGGFDAGGDICVRFPEHEGIKCYAMVSGESRLGVEGVPDPVGLRTGDCFLLPRGWPFRLAKPFLRGARWKPPAPIGSNLSQVELCGWRLLRASNALQQCRYPAPCVAGPPRQSISL